MVVNNPTEAEMGLIDAWLAGAEVKRGIMAREHWTGPADGTPHLHILVQFVDQQVLAEAWKAARGLGRAHVEPVVSWKASVVYHRKGGEHEPHKPEWGEGVVWERGDLDVGQGKRSDLDGPCELVMAGGTVAEVAQAFPTVYVRYARGLQSLVSLQMKPRDLVPAMPRVLTLWGSTGMGKSGRARLFGQRHGPMFTKHGATDLWWDGYQGEKVILLEEFRGDKMKRSDLLNLIDSYECRRQVKGGTVEIQADTFLICSPRAPSEWYTDWGAGDDAAQLDRRLTAARGHPDSRIYNVDRCECTDFDGRRLDVQPVRGSMLDGVMREESEDEAE